MSPPHQKSPFPHPPTHPPGYTAQATLAAPRGSGSRTWLGTGRETRRPRPLLLPPVWGLGSPAPVVGLGVGDVVGGVGQGGVSPWDDAEGTHLRLHLHLHTPLHLRTHTPTHTPTPTHTTHLHTDTPTHRHTYTHTQRHTHLHLHTHTTTAPYIHAHLGVPLQQPVHRQVLPHARPQVHLQRPQQLLGAHLSSSHA